MKRILSFCILALLGWSTVVMAEDKAAVKKVALAEEGEGVVCSMVDQKPSFPGGQESLDKFLERNLRKPETVRENNIRGRVVCQFTVNENGSVTDIEIVRSNYPAMNDEILRVLQYMPRWEPGQKDGKPVASLYTATMNYYLP